MREIPDPGIGGVPRERLSQKPAGETRTAKPLGSYGYVQLTATANYSQKTLGGTSVKVTAFTATGNANAGLAAQNHSVMLLLAEHRRSLCLAAESARDACEPVAHAETTQKLGPRAPNVIAT